MPGNLLYPEENVEEFRQILGGTALSVSGNVGKTHIKSALRLRLSKGPETLSEAVVLLRVAGFGGFVQI